MFLFFTRSDHFLTRCLVTLFARSFRGAVVDPAAISSHSYLDAMHRYGGGYATLAVFERPADASANASLASITL